MRILFHLTVIVPCAILGLLSFLVVFAFGLMRDALALNTAIR